MAGLVLSPDDRTHFLTLMRRQTNSAVHRRVNVLLLDDGWSVARIAAALSLDASTVAEHRALYAQRGRADVESLSYTGDISRLSAGRRAILADWIAAEVPQTAQALCDWVQGCFGVTYAPHAMARLLGRIGFVFETPRCVPAKADAAIHRAFLDATLRPPCSRCVCGDPRRRTHLRGDTIPRSDATLYTFITHLPCPVVETPPHAAGERHPNPAAFVERMRVRFHPDLSPMLDALVEPAASV